MRHPDLYGEMGKLEELGLSILQFGARAHDTDAEIRFVRRL